MSLNYCIKRTLKKKRYQRNFYEDFFPLKKDFTFQTWLELGMRLNS